MDAVVVFFVAPAVVALGLPASTFFGAAAAFFVAAGLEAGVAFAAAGFFAVVDLAPAAVFEGGLEFYKRQHEINMSAPDKGGGPE